MREHLFLPAPSSPHVLCYPDFMGGYSGDPSHAVDRPARTGDLQLNRLYNLHLVLGGKGRIETAGQSFELGAGTGFLYGPGAAQRYAADSAEPWEIRWVHFACAAADSLLGGRGLGEVWLFHLPDPAAALECLEELLTLGRNFDPHCEARVSALLYELLLHIVEGASPPAAPRDPAIPSLQAAADYIRNHCARPSLSIAEVAGAAGYSVPYFSRKFHQLIGCTPTAYLLEARILHAKRLLVSTPQTVRQIAADSGFSQSSYFIQCFRKATGTTPERFRVSRRV